MKLLLILLFVLNVSAQQVSVGLDISNAINGSYVNAPALDIQAKISDVTDHREIGLQVEYFKEIDYFSWGMFANKQINVSQRLKLLAGIEGIQIVRGKFTALGYGFNAETRYWITDNIGASLQFNYRRRGDLELLYNDGRFVESGWFNLIYKW